MTRQNGAYDDGSYWKLVETPDLYEIEAFMASEAIGNIGASYNMEALNGKNVTIAEGSLALAASDSFDENQEWYFVGTGNSTGWQIASAAEPATVVALDENGDIALGEGLTTRWKVNASKEHAGYFSFTNGSTVLTVDGESLFKFNRLRSAFTRKLQIYNNPCGSVGNNHITSLVMGGEAAYSNIIYEAQTKPGTWHVVYAKDKGEVAKNGTFDIDIVLAGNAATDLVVNAYFDWNSDGIFETTAPIEMNGKEGNVEVTVPEWATMEQTRMRVRVNNNGLDLAEDEVNGFIYDFHIKVVEPQENRTATVAANSWERGEVTLSEVADSYSYGTQLTAKATAFGTAKFVCWREEGVVVSTDAEYTFTVDHNVKLVAYFSPNTDESTYPTGIASTIENSDVTVAQQGNDIVAQGGNVTGMTLYTIDAATVAHSNGATMNIVAVKEGIYIVRVSTANGYKNVKIFIKK
jgi:hypothetical protein